MSPVPPRFIYFDLGNVLLRFSHELAARQMAEVAGVSPEQVWEILFDSDLELRYERGEISSREFYEQFCERSGSRPDYAELCRAASDIFELNVPIVPIVSALRSTGQRLGILSNTNEIHWEFVGRGRYNLVRQAFEVFALSYEIGAMKPEPAIYGAAAELAGVAAGEIFFMDDREDNVAAAQQAGFDAVLFTSPRQLAQDLRSRGVRLNY